MEPPTKKPLAYQLYRSVKTYKTNFTSGVKLAFCLNSFKAVLIYENNKIQTWDLKKNITILNKDLDFKFDHCLLFDEEHLVFIDIKRNMFAYNVLNGNLDLSLNFQLPTYTSRTGKEPQYSYQDPLKDIYNTLEIKKVPGKPIICLQERKKQEDIEFDMVLSLVTRGSATSTGVINQIVYGSNSRKFQTLAVLASEQIVMFTPSNPSSVSIEFFLWDHKKQIPNSVCAWSLSLKTQLYGIIIDVVTWVDGRICFIFNLNGYGVPVCCLYDTETRDELVLDLKILNKKFLFTEYFIAQVLRYIPDKNLLLMEIVNINYGGYVVIYNIVSNTMVSYFETCDSEKWEVSESGYYSINYVLDYNAVEKIEEDSLLLLKAHSLIPQEIAYIFLMEMSGLDISKYGPHIKDVLTCLTETR